MGTPTRQNRTVSLVMTLSILADESSLILTFAQDTVDLDHVLQSTWGSNLRTYELSLALVRKVWLCRMRGLSTGWRDAGESADYKVG